MSYICLIIAPFYNFTGRATKENEAKGEPYRPIGFLLKVSWALKDYVRI